MNNNIGNSKGNNNTKNNNGNNKKSNIFNILRCSTINKNIKRNISINKSVLNRSTNVGNLNRNYNNNRSVLFNRNFTANINTNVSNSRNYRNSLNNNVIDSVTNKNVNNLNNSNSNSNSISLINNIDNCGLQYNSSNVSNNNNAINLDNYSVNNTVGNSFNNLNETVVSTSKYSNISNLSSSSSRHKSSNKIEYTLSDRIIDIESSITSSDYPRNVFPIQEMSLLEHFSIDTVESSFVSSYTAITQTLPGIYAMQMIPKHTITETYSIQSLVCARILDKRSRVYCGLQSNSSNILNVNSEILRFIKFSKDIQSYNAVFEWLNDGVRLRVLQDIAKDTEIVVWFTEEISLIMSIPFLSPINIRGNDCYMCHVCHKVFSTPHPLKVHLALACDSFDVNILWLRLYYMKKAVCNQSQDQIFELFKGPHLTTKKNDINNRLYGAPLSWTPQSAFKPIKASITSTSTPAAITTNFYSKHTDLSTITLNTDSNSIHSSSTSNFSILHTIENSHLLNHNLNSNLVATPLQLNTTLPLKLSSTELLTSRTESVLSSTSETVTSNLTSTPTTSTLLPTSADTLETSESFKSTSTLSTTSLRTALFPSMLTSTFPTPFTSSTITTLTAPITEMTRTPTLLLPLSITPTTSLSSIIEHPFEITSNTTVPIIDGAKQFNSHLHPLVISNPDEDKSKLVDRSSVQYCNQVDVTDEKYASEMETIASNLGSSMNGHLCIFCGKVYSRKYGLKIHIRTHSGYKPLKCKYCQRPFGDPSNLNKHVRLHLQSDHEILITESERVQNEITCQMCNKTLKNDKNLQRHLKLHQRYVDDDQH